MHPPILDVRAASHHRISAGRHAKAPAAGDDPGAAGVITASEPSRMAPFTGLSPRDFRKLMAVPVGSRPDHRPHRPTAGTRTPAALPQGRRADCRWRPGPHSRPQHRRAVQELPVLHQPPGRHRRPPPAWSWRSADPRRATGTTARHGGNPARRPPSAGRRPSPTAAIRAPVSSSRTGDRPAGNRPSDRPGATVRTSRSAPESNAHSLKWRPGRSCATAAPRATESTTPCSAPPGSTTSSRPRSGAVDGPPAPSRPLKEDRLRESPWCVLTLLAAGGFRQGGGIAAGGAPQWLARGSTQGCAPSARHLRPRDSFVRRSAVRRTSARRPRAG